MSDQQAWNDARRLCRLSSRQVEMARALGMNPKRLPGLRPSPRERWKLPVGAFIEECYRKRFGGPPDSEKSRSRRRERSLPPEDAREMARAAMDQAADLACYAANLADDLQRWLQHGTIPVEVLTQVRDELREIADALGAGASIPQMPEIPSPPERRRPAPRRGRERPFYDEEDELPS